jgi:hypothetical protein
VPGWRIGRHLCTDPGQYGHANVHGTPGKSPTPAQQTAEDQAAEAARQTDERRRVRQRNTQWRAATQIRTSHLKAVLGRKTPPAGALKLIVEAMARGHRASLGVAGTVKACSATRLPARILCKGRDDPQPLMAIVKMPGISRPCATR